MTFGLAVLIGNVIATGIMRTPGDIAAQLPSPSLILLFWVIGGVYALFGAMSLAEAGVITRRSGGLYPIVHRGLGRYPGFIVGWTDWISICSSTALGAIACGDFVAPVLPGLPGGSQTIAVFLILGFGALLWNGIKAGDAAQRVLSGLKALAFVGLIGCALLMAVPAPAVPTAPVATSSGFLAAAILALQGIIFTYDGWTGPLYFGEETVDIGRTMPRTMIGGILIVIAIYVLFNVAMLRVLGVEGMAGEDFVAGAASAALFGSEGDMIIRIIVIVAIMGGINSNILFGGRVPLAMSRDGLLPRAIDRVNAGGTPVVSHALSVGLATAFVVSGTFETVLAISAFFFVANYLMTFSAVFALRRREPVTPRPFRVPGFPFTTGLVLVGSFAFLIGSVIADRDNSVLAIGMLAVSYPVFRMIGGARDR